MDENNQILDVTYGNFSCRLEGFEDSVETMKTVVSFFHDLAGHNRFMDVSPQAPDMETLAKLTEEQAGVAVEAEGDGNHVSLRAVQDDAAEDDLAEEMAEELTEATLIDEAGSEEEEVESEASVTDKLDRIRAVTSQETVEAEAEDFSEDLSEPEVQEAPKAKGVNPLAQRLADLAKRTSQTRVLDASNEYVESDLAQAAEELASDVEDDIEELADELDAGLNEAIEDVAGTDLEDQLEDALESIEDEVAAESSEDDMSDDLDVDDLDDALEEAIADEEMAEPEIREEPEAAIVDELAEIEQDIDAAVAAEVEKAEEDAISEDELLTDEAEEAAAGESDDEAPEEVAEDEPETPVAAERERSTTLVLKPSDVADPPLPEGIDRDKVDNATDDDFDLATEVALVEAEIARRQGNEVARHGLSRRVEDAMSRIMSQTDQHLAKPESRRHRDAFAQLKAAVAATEAARQLGDKGEEARDPDEVFKDDLDAHASKEEAAKAAPETPAVPETQPTEDVVKSSDNVKPLDAASERLRQIQSQKENDGGSETTGFKEFAEAHGATELVDMLEAAGAYICYVEGEADFSRPQVMKVVQTASETEISREDGLRCFGRLLRQARLVKLANGRFQVAESSQYRPTDERAAQA